MGQHQRFVTRMDNGLTGSFCNWSRLRRDKGPWGVLPETRTARVVWPHAVVEGQLEGLHEAIGQL